MRIFAGAILVALFVFVVAGCGGGGGDHSSGPVGSLQGYLYIDAAGSDLQVSPSTRESSTPASGAVVTVRGLNISATAGDDGLFQLNDIPSGEHQFYVEYPGHTRAVFEATINGGMNTAPTRTLSQASVELKWMVMVYMAADNSLDSDAVADLNEMEMAPNNSQVMTVALCDRTLVNDSAIYQIQHDTSPNTVTSPRLPLSLGELDTGDPDTLSWFVNYCETSLPPAEHYMLILWDHGSGWDTYNDRATSPTVTTRVIGEDDTSHSVMRIIDIPDAVRKMYPIDIIATDACLMNMLEVAYEWRNCADYMIGSEDETPGEGFPYQLVLSTLNSDAGLQMTPGQFASDMSQKVFNYWDDNYLNPPGEATIDLTRLDSVATALDAFSSRLLAVGKNYTTQLSDINSSVESFYYYSDRRADLYHYAELVSSKIGDSQLRTAAGNLKTAVQAAVPTNMHPTNRPNVHGICIYLPSRTDYIRNAATVYPGLALSADTHWNEWLAGQP